MSTCLTAVFNYFCHCVFHSPNAVWWEILSTTVPRLVGPVSSATRASQKRAYSKRRSRSPPHKHMRCYTSWTQKNHRSERKSKEHTDSLLTCELD